MLDGQVLLWALYVAAAELSPVRQETQQSRDPFVPSVRQSARLPSLATLYFFVSISKGMGKSKMCHISFSFAHCYSFAASSRRSAVVGRVQ